MPRNMDMSKKVKTKSLPLEGKGNRLRWMRWKCMKKISWYISLIWAITLYFSVCAITIMIYGTDFIPHCGFQEYSLYEKIFMNLLFFIPMILTAFVLKRDSIRNFLILSGVFLASSFVLCHLINVPEIVSLYVSGYETFTHEVNWLRDDIWFYSYCGALSGVIIALIISTFRSKKKF